MTLKVLSTNIPLAWLNVLAQTIDSTESLDIQTQVKGLSLESYLEVQKRKLTKHSVNPEQEWFKQCLQDKTKLCIWEYLRDISIKKLTNANTFSNSQCSQSNGLLMIMNLTTNKTSGWYYDISSNESRFITKIASYLHPIEECQVVERRDSIPLMSETTIHDTCCQKHRIRSKSFVPFALHNDLLAVCSISTQWIMILRDIW